MADSWQTDLYYLPRDIENIADNLKSIGDSFMEVGNLFMKNKLYSLSFSTMDIATRANRIKDAVLLKEAE